ncbi:MAG: GAF domain-containing protein [Cellvibrionaceae bacterium]
MPAPIKPTIGICQTLISKAFAHEIKNAGFPILEISAPDSSKPVDVLVLSCQAQDSYTSEQWQTVCKGSMIYEISPGKTQGLSGLLIPHGCPDDVSLSVIRHACEHELLKQRESALYRELAEKHGHLAQLTGLGVALSSERDLDKLLLRILEQGISLGYCDAASLFLVEENKKELVFKLTRNNSIKVPFKEQRIALTTHSIVGYVATTKKEVNIEDCYDISDQEPYSFNNSFDRTIGYRTCSLIALPMLNHRGECLGVLEFINRKLQPNIVLDNPLTTPELTQPFNERRIALLRALASLAAVAIENQQLMENIRNLFDNFVEASVFAIEQRDPTTSGHSFRVADLCLALADAAPKAPCRIFNDKIMTEQDITQLRYAALLHDFGKVGVREAVLVKANKLYPWELDVLRYRLALAKEHCQRKHYEQLLKLPLDNDDYRHQLEVNFQQEMQLLDTYQDVILESNQPSILAKEHSEKLHEIRDYLVQDNDGNICSLLSETEFTSLTIPKGSLTDVERLEIESHVTHTMNFLQRIPWTPELSAIPEIAGAHHEKLDGSGYPHGEKSGGIPYASQIMAICDIYDALTANDRPYKSAVPRDKAFAILEFEAKDNKLNSDLVNIFIHEGCHEAIKNEHYPPSTGKPCTGSNHPCGHDHDHD